MSKLEQILVLDPPNDLRFKGKGTALAVRDVGAHNPRPGDSFHSASGYLGCAAAAILRKAARISGPLRVLLAGRTAAGLFGV